MILVVPHTVPVVVRILIGVQGKRIPRVAPAIIVVIEVLVVTSPVPVSVDPLQYIERKSVLKVVPTVPIIVRIGVVTHAVPVEVHPLRAIKREQVGIVTYPVPVCIGPLRGVIHESVRVVTEPIPIGVLPLVRVVYEEVRVVPVSIPVRVSDKAREGPLQCLSGPSEVVQRRYVAPRVYPPVGHSVPRLAVQELELVRLVGTIVPRDVPRTEVCPTLIAARPSCPVLYRLVRRGIWVAQYRTPLVPDYSISSRVDMEDIRPSDILASAEVIPSDSV